MRSEERDEGERWRRIVVADGVELLVREETYQRRRDRIDWLIDWAWKMMDSMPRGSSIARRGSAHGGSRRAEAAALDRKFVGTKAVEPACR